MKDIWSYFGGFVLLIIWLGFVGLIGTVLKHSYYTIIANSNFVTSAATGIVITVLIWLALRKLAQLEIEAKPRVTQSLMNFSAGLLLSALIYCFMYFLYLVNVIQLEPTVDQLTRTAKRANEILMQREAEQLKFKERENSAEEFLHLVRRNCLNTTSCILAVFYEDCNIFGRCSYKPRHVDFKLKQNNKVVQLQRKISPFITPTGDHVDLATLKISVEGTEWNWNVNWLPNEDVLNYNNLSASIRASLREEKYGAISKYDVELAKRNYHNVFNFIWWSILDTIPGSLHETRYSTKIKPKNTLSNVIYHLMLYLIFIILALAGGERILVAFKPNKSKDTSDSDSAGAV